MNSDEIERLLAMDDDDIFASLGSELTGRQLLPSSKGEFIRIGRLWFERQARELTDVVCSHEKLTALRRRPENQISTAELVAGVADVISGLVVGASPFTVSVLLVRFGLDKLCGPLPAAEEAPASEQAPADA